MCINVLPTLLADSSIPFSSYLFISCYTIDFAFARREVRKRINGNDFGMNKSHFDARFDNAKQPHKCLSESTFRILTTLLFCLKKDSAGRAGSGSHFDQLLASPVLVPVFL